MNYTYLKKNIGRLLHLQHCVQQLYRLSNDFDNVLENLWANCKGTDSL